MPKAEATTGLAPKKASATDPLMAAKSPSEGFGFEVILSLVEPLRSGGLGLRNARDRRAGFARRSICLWLRRRCSVARIGHLDGLAQRGARPDREILHPIAFAFGLGGWARGLSLSRFGRRQLAQGWCTAAHTHISALELRRDGPVQALLYPHHGFAHSYLNVPAVDLVKLSVISHGVIIGHLSLFGVAQDRRQVVLFAQRPMGVGSMGRRHRQGLVPPRQVLFLQVSIGLLDGAHPGHPHPLSPGGPGPSRIGARRGPWPA